ncbi:interferon-induced very large GTPase 1-like [Meriones unguiculatus]|uniref:interferon-induced very large GTPase 1-like n=1 Tax=Meriones unguiculatus TaxID=10047 RepID=UPI00293E9396|nr:interferon-induced very large GTPase 1-like [Meriones unguiculatus]XP_060223764.1 interferon-induced very large GTPase 1-like [Meriones unguiculatus]XP_060223765.1 interferon-induced very large GTPase 1-like [Meriones unguiculatus]XP_060223766.1 interferon-induced very large GTPase 1-like [Meriones unguiculatus]
MATAKSNPDEPQLRCRRKQELQDVLTEAGLSVDYWLPKLQEGLGVTCAQALQHLEGKDLQKLKSQTQHAWEEKALEKLLDLSQRHSVEIQETAGEMVKNRQRQAGQALQELRALQSEGKHRQEEAVRRKEAELRQAMEIPEECWPMPEVPLREVTEILERHLSHMEQTLAHSQNLSDRDLVRWASGGLALQGIYKTSHQKDLLARREELLSVPKEFSLAGPEHSTWTESKEFSSFQEQAMFTQTMEKLGFSRTSSIKGGGWGLSLEAGVGQSKHTESEDTHQSHSEQSYFCSAKFSYIPLATCHFPIDHLQLSEAALQELKSIEELLDQTTHPDRLLLLRHRAENFFHRFGSHANQGPLHLGGVYCWKAIAEGFKSEQLADVKQQTEESLNIYIKGSYNGFGVKGDASLNMPDSHSKTVSYSKTHRNFQTKVHLSVAQTGGPAKAHGIAQWTTGLVTSNQTWSVIDRGLQLVPIWDIILSSHRSDFKDALQVANCLKDNYTALTGLTVEIQEGEEFLTAKKEARLFLDNVKRWEVSDPEEQLNKLMDFMQTLSQKIKSYSIWINTCLTDWDLQNFLVNTVNFCKNSPTYKTRFIKSQLCSLLEPHVYKVTNFPQAHAIIQWINQSEPEEEQVKITSFSEFIKTLENTCTNQMEVNIRNESPETREEAKRRATYEVTTALSSFLLYLRETEQPDLQLLLLSIAAGSGYQVENNIFQHLLGCNELNFLLDLMQSNQDKYQELKNICSYRAQAFLVLTALTATVEITDISTEEKRKRLTLIRQHIGNLSEEVAHVLTKHGMHPDWENLESDLRLLVDGDYKATIPSLQMDEVKKQLQSLCHEKKETYKQQSNENNTKEMTAKGPFLDLLQRLGLEHHYPKRMSRADFHLIYKTSVYNTQPRSEQELPFYFLQKLLMLDYGLRYLVFKDDENIENHISIGSSNHESEDFDPYEDVIKDNDSLTYPSATQSRPHIHPMDIQMAILHCADDLTRQYILSKLSICQYALPLVVPNPNTSQIEFYLWSLRQIRKSWQNASRSPEDKTYSHKNQQMCCVSTPIVSFIRVGNGLSASKSQIMNSLLSKRKHDVFFHRHCRGSSKHCLLMQGVIEICWFCPGGQGEDTFDKCLTFTNLHGDAKEHRQQLSFLQDVSSLIVILMSASDDNEDNKNLVRHLCQSSRPLIFLIDDKEKAIANNSGKRLRIGIRNRNEAELTEELTNAIKHFLEMSDSPLSLEDCSQMAQKQGFLIDEDQIHCKEAKEKAQTIMALLEEYKLPQTKENLLPLQGQLWHLWCKKDKEFYHLREKGNRSIEQHKSEIETDKRIIRCRQLEKAFPLNDLMRSVLELLQEYSETHKRLYFLQWLTLFFDSLFLEHLKNLHEKQRSLWLMVQREKQRAQKSNSLTLWQQQIEAISTEIHDCTLGTEHLLREVGQIYEALEETSSSRDSLFLCLPEIAADLMIAGVPIELMDGDASYVPLKWVAAIFDKVSEKVGDKRLFVLSVLGLQSSGKSTLLNALFGLQFTVSAGRCTKGAYMQLLKVEDTFTEELGFDFVLVVDTEGLRAPELNNKSQNWDNELATFVIGLGNLTLINIFGENPSEMQDILQIAVQAFLRMKQVKISPSCLFVHQNVGEITAKDQNMEGRRCLEQRLDEMAVTAAEQEECSNVSHFSDVIKFDANSHVYYFAHLWDGNPPMAPPNPHYSHNVQELKSRIILTAKQESRSSIMKISDVKFRIQDLWKALVNENFIFSFRNTREIMAMSKLETMYNHWTWELRSHMLDFQNQLINQIQNGKVQALQTSIFEAPVTEKYIAIKQELEKYFSENPDNEILIQWKSNFENKLIILKEALISDTRRKANELIQFKKNQDRLDKKKSSYENELLERSRKLALTVKDKELDEEELHEKFNQLWKKWVCDVSSDLPPVIEPDIDTDSENILWEHFQKEINMVDILMRNSEDKFQINYDEHVKMNKKYSFVARTLKVCDRESINMTTEKIITRFNETINNLHKKQCDYNTSYFHEILRLIEEEVKSAPTEDRYTFTSKYSIDLSLCLFQRAAKSFKEMHKAFKRANDPVNYLERKKDDFFMSFKISCQGATSIKTFVDFLWHKLTPAISATIRGKMVIKIAGAMRANCPEFNGNRANLEKHILISLAEEENFDNYWQYLHYTKSFFSSYIENHIKRYCSDEGSKNIKTFFKICLSDIKNAILSAIHESTTVAKDKGSTASGWLDLFCDHLGSNLVFPRRDLVSIEHQEIKDTEFLKEAMSAALDPAMRKVEEDCSSKPVDEMVPDIEKILSEHLCGCWKQCPLCNAICTNTIPQHEGDHSVPFHRPQAVSGWHKHKTDHFVIDCCTSSVASDRFMLLGTNQEIPYKNYRQAGGDYATWSITPDSSTQSYWKWFVCHFRSELEKKYQKKFTDTGEIPKAWAKITKEDVLNDLKEQ